jgi:hypothetical protein
MELCVPGRCRLSLHVVHGSVLRSSTATLRTSGSCKQHRECFCCEKGRAGRSPGQDRGRSPLRPGRSCGPRRPRPAEPQAPCGSPCCSRASQGCTLGHAAPMVAHSRGQRPSSAESPLGSRLCWRNGGAPATTTECREWRALCTAARAAAAGAGHRCMAQDRRQSCRCGAGDRRRLLAGLPLSCTSMREH